VLTLVEHDRVRVIEGTRGESLLRRSRDAASIIEACLSARVRVALLYPENLTAHFFDLSSGEAGEILDKLRRFGIRLAIVCGRPGSIAFSRRFPEILSDDLRLFETRDEACRWLANQTRAQSE